ncbi:MULTISPECIES: hypothetical protein [unclassified Streptomyces]|nr:hypothetical protein OG311_40080 [Streptomyces sp. NBC_01343]
MRARVHVRRAATGANDERRASEGIREVQKGISRPASAVSLIRSDLEGR